MEKFLVFKMSPIVRYSPAEIARGNTSQHNMNKLGMSILSPNYAQYTHDKQHHRYCRNRDKHSKWLRRLWSGARQAGDSEEDCWVGCIQDGSDDNQASSEPAACHPPQWKCYLICGLAASPDFRVKEHPTGRRNFSNLPRCYSFLPDRPNNRDEGVTLRANGQVFGPLNQVVIRKCPKELFFSWAPFHQAAHVRLLF
jgi:hypothetical protein